MKKFFLILVLCTGSTIIFAQQNWNRRNPPAAVQRSWKKDFPGRDNDAWEWKNNHWRARYKDRDHNDRNVDVFYDKYGRRRYSQTEWDRNDLPERVQNRIRSRYRTNNYSAYRIERPSGGFYFQITLGNNRSVYLDNQGRETTHY